MKKKFKKLIALTMAITCFASLAITSTATFNGVDDKQYIPTLDEQLERVMADDIIDSEMKESIIEKIMISMNPETARSASGNTIMSRSSNTLAVPYFNQEFDHYCGPATVKQTVHFFNGFSWSQADIARSIGTTPVGSDINNMITYIFNSTSNHYIIKWLTSNPAVTEMRNLMVEGIDYWGMPPIPCIKISAINISAGLRYITDGHVLNVSGYNFSNTSNRRYEVTDPFGKGHGVANGKYEINETALLNSIVAHKDRFFAW